MRGLVVATLLVGSASCGGGAATTSSPVISAVPTTTVPLDTTTVPAVTTPPTTTSMPVPTTTSPAPTAPPSLAQLVPRVDGVGPFLFGTDQRVVEPWVTAMLGGPDSSTVPSGVVHLGCVEPGSGEPVSTVVHAWSSVGLALVFSRSTSGAVDTCGTESRLWAWALTTPAGDGWRPTTEDGIRIGTTLTEVRRAGLEVRTVLDAPDWPEDWFVIVSPSPVVPAREGWVDTSTSGHPITTLFGGHWFWEFECAGDC